MFKNYIIQFGRRIARDKTYSFLNIIGLSAGLTCFAFISLWVNSELNYDSFNKNYDRIARLNKIVKTETDVLESARSGATLAEVLQHNFPEVENTVRMDMREEVVQYKDKLLQERIILTDPSFFKIFSYHLTKGNSATAISEPFSVILTESTARKYFGDTYPIGETLKIYMYDGIEMGKSYKVTGITPDPPQNAHFTFSIMASFSTVETANPEVLKSSDQDNDKFYTYLLLKPSADYKTLSGKITQLFTQDLGSRVNAPYSYKLQPLRDIHLSAHVTDEEVPGGNKSYVYIFSTIGIFILLLAGINYTNLATARSVSRAKEVSIKKVVGANKKQIILQYLLESVLMSILALLLAFVISFFLQPFFYQITGKNLSIFSSPPLLLFLTGVTVFLGILSGIYPAFILSAFKPASILTGPFKSGATGVLLRQSLVIAQFVITIILVTSVVVIYWQMSFIKHKDLGYNKNALLFLRVSGNTDVVNGYEAFKNELAANPLISGVATSNSLIINGLDKVEAQTINATGKSVRLNIARLGVDENYLKVYGIKLIAGRNLTHHALNDSSRQILVNESMVKSLGLPNAENAIGKPFSIDGQPGTIIGVIHDFHFDVLQRPIEPLAIYPREERFSRITIKLADTHLSQGKELVEEVGAKHFPNALFDYDFLDKQLEAQYQAEVRFSRIVLYFSILSLLIACLGLYGLISYLITQKTKEIGIRKILGATINGIVIMLSKDFLKLVVFACFLAIPVACFIMHKWLQDFAYRISISWWMVAASIVPVLLMALLTVSLQTIKAALVNPVKSLRNE
ncbi:MAG: ABC transporter permease [Bacteroidota bacterium]|nr:ABC transporter permease [Bacteroidota bacterium]